MTTKTKTERPVAMPAGDAGGDDRLARYDRLAAALHETSASIPADLAEEARLYGVLGTAEVAGDNAAQLRSKLDAVKEHRETSVRRRAAASDGLAKMEGELLDARRDADDARSALAGAAISELQNEWSQTIGRLAEIHGRVQVFQQVMRTQVSLPMPFRAVLDLQGAPKLQFIAAANAPPTLPPSLQSLTDLIDRLDIAAGLAGGIRASREQDQRHYQISLQRRAPADMPGQYVCRKPVSHWGAVFPQGAVIDQTVVCVSSLYRLQVAHAIMLADRAAVAA